MKLSFGDYLIQEFGNDAIDKYWSDKNKINPFDISCGSSTIKVWIKCQEKDYHEDYEIRCNDFFKGSRCGYCSSRGGKVHPKDSFAQWGIDNFGDDFLAKYWSKRNTLNPWKLTTNVNKDIFINCQNKRYHNEYRVKAYHFTKGDGGCPYCTNSNGKVHPLDSLGELFSKSVKIWSDKNTKTPYEFSPKSHSKVWWKCENSEHADYKRTIKDSNKLEFRCPKCSRDRMNSILQEKVSKYIKRLGYEIRHEFECSVVPINPKSKAKLPFDNEVVELKLIIEVHGEQHYKVTGFSKLHAKRKGITPLQELKYQQLKDRYKSFIAYKQGYHYLEISYLDDDENETWKQKINNKIKEIVCK